MPKLKVAFFLLNHLQGNVNTCIVSFELYSNSTVKRKNVKILSILLPSHLAELLIF